MTQGAVLYARVSTKEQAQQNNSLPVQQGKFREFCARRGLIVLKTFIDQQSGRTADERPQFQEMLTFCRQNRKRVVCVVVADLSRLARNVADQAHTISTLSQLGIKLVSIDEPNLDNTAAGRLSSNVIGAMNQYFSDSLSERTKDRMKAAVKNGRFIWVSPIGYVNDKNGSGSVIKLDPQRAPLVRKGFELMASGAYSSDEVLRQLNALGLTSKKGRPLPRQTWYSILRNPLYCGWVKSGELLVRGVHQPLVSQKLFDSVQDILGDRSRTAQPRQSLHPEFPLRQFVRCEKCNRGLTSGLIKKKFSYYWCYTKGCRNVLVPAAELEQHFIRLLGMLQPTIELLEQLPEIARKQWAAREERNRQDSKALRAKLEDIKRLNSAAIKAKLSGELTAEDFDSIKMTNAEEKTAIESQLTALESEKMMMEELMEQSQRELLDVVSAWKKSGAPQKRELQNVLFADGLVWSHESGFLNSKNTRLMQDLNEAFQELANSSTTAEELTVKFGVPDGI